MSKADENQGGLIQVFTGNEVLVLLLKEELETIGV